MPRYRRHLCRHSKVLIFVASLPGALRLPTAPYAQNGQVPDSVIEYAGVQLLSECWTTHCAPTPRDPRWLMRANKQAVDWPFAFFLSPHGMQPLASIRRDWIEGLILRQRRINHSRPGPIRVRQHVVPKGCAHHAISWCPHGSDNRSRRATIAFPQRPTLEHRVFGVAVVGGKGSSRPARSCCSASFAPAVVTKTWYP